MTIQDKNAEIPSVAEASPSGGIVNVIELMKTREFKRPSESPEDVFSGLAYDGKVTSANMNHSYLTASLDVKINPIPMDLGAKGPTTSLPLQYRFDGKPHH